MQSNHEGVLIDAIHAAREDLRGHRDQPGRAHPHVGRAARRAVRRRAAGRRGAHHATCYEREEFRHHSYVADVAVVHVIGEGVAGYATAVDRLIDVITGQADG